MVKIHRKSPPKENPPFFNRSVWLIVVALTGFMLYFGLPPFIEMDEAGNYVLSAERLRDYEEKPQRSEQVEVYQLIATRTGLYPCLQCSGVKTIKLNKGESWKYGISRNGKSRYQQAFYISNSLTYQTITITDILEAEQLEKKLIISYPLLPEAQKRMKLYGIFLKRPPGNAKDH